ncbi:hypothetical protein [Rhizobium sp. 12,4]|uniref:hypothetical protein n=1 Tax=Rhizobium sp. 12,4 TaxID=3405135 RepID=UPI003D3586FD
MKKPTPAGLKVLSAFIRRPDDDFEAKSFKMWQIQNRSGLRSVNIYRVVEKLEAEGFLSSNYGIDGNWWSLTEAGLKAISES